MTDTPSEAKPNTGTAGQGAGDEHLDQGQSLDGAPKAPPAPANAPEPKAEKPEGLDEVHTDPKEPVKPEPKEPPAPQPEPVQLTEYITLEDPAGQAAIDLLKESGVSPTEANAIFAKALETNDLNDIDVAALEAKVGKTKATLIMSGVTDYYGRTKAANDAATKAVYEIVGGEDAWGTLRDWAQTQEKSDEAFKTRLDQLREMLNKGGFYAEAAGRELKRMYDADAGTKGLDNKKVVRGDGGDAPKTGTPLSRADYLSELKKAHQEGKPPAFIAALDQRRLAGKRAGL